MHIIYILITEFQIGNPGLDVSGVPRDADDYLRLTLSSHSTLPAHFRLSRLVVVHAFHFEAEEIAELTLKAGKIGERAQIF